MNYQVFRDNMTGLAEYFNKVLTPELTEIYRRKLEHLSDQEFVAAVDKCIDELNYFPKPSDLNTRIPESKSSDKKSSISY